MNRRFTDLSSNNADPAVVDAGIDFAQYAAWGAVIVSIKVSEGLDYVNPYWTKWATEAHRHGIGVLFYHFARPGDGREQATFFLDHLKRSGLYEEHHGDGICLDLERMGEVPDPRAFLAGFESVCRARGHRSLVLYSELSYFDEHPQMRPRSKRLWVAAYPALPAGWRGHVWAHQYTDHESVPGVGASDCSFLTLRAYIWHRRHRPRRSRAMLQQTSVPIGDTTKGGIIATLGSFAVAAVIYLTGSHDAQSTQALGAAVSGLVFGSITMIGRYAQAHKQIGQPIADAEHVLATLGIKLPSAEEIGKAAAPEVVKLLGHVPVIPQSDRPLPPS